MAMPARPSPTLPSPYLVAVALLLALVLPNPAGYVGAAGDDYYYVQAARCVATHGWCIPETHWGARWPLVAPMGGVFALFGDGLWQSMLVPFAYSIMAVLFFVRLLDRSWGRATALVGGIAFVATASFAKGLLQPNVETIEVAWLIAAAWAGQNAISPTARPMRWALVAGLFLGLAVQARMTSLAWLPIFGIGLAVVPRRYRALAIPALAGVAIPIGADMLVNWHLAGNALLNQHLSIIHTSIVSSELPSWVDRSRPPLFNPQFIDGWAPAMGIHTHWTVQGALNLLLNPQMGPVLIVALLLLLVARKRLSWRAPEVLLAATALLYAGALIYALAIDPKARMFLPVAAIAAALVGRLGILLWQGRGPRILVATAISAIAIIGAIETGKRFDMTIAGPLAGQWARENPGQVAVEFDTAHTLTFDATVRSLPVWPREARSRLIMLVADQCGARANMTLLRTHDFGRKGDPLNLCEFRLSGPARLPHP